MFNFKELMFILLLTINYSQGYSPDLDCYQPHLEILSACCQDPGWQNSDTYSSSKCISNKPTCISECIFNETIQLPNGEIDLNGIRTSLQTDMDRNAEFAPIVIKAFETCVQRLQNKRNQMHAETGECHPFALTLFACIHSYTLSNCPNTKWTTNEACNSAKDNIQRCFND